MDNEAQSFGIVLTQRDEGPLLQANVTYHLAMGVSHIVVIDNDSSDLITLGILGELRQKTNLTVVLDHGGAFDQERLVNAGIAYLLRAEPQTDWVMSLDVDEFLSVPNGLRSFLNYLRATKNVYGAIQMFNNIPERQCHYHTIVPLYLGAPMFYQPEIERAWQEPGHFAKAICRAHTGMRAAVGNHFFYHDKIIQSFPTAPYSPFAINAERAVLLHFEMRDAGKELLKKWRDLSERHRVPGAAPNAAWWEKRDRMRDLELRFRDNPNALYSFIVDERRTLWGTSIPEEKLKRYNIVRDTLLS